MRIVGVVIRGGEVADRPAGLGHAVRLHQLAPDRLDRPGQHGRRDRRRAVDQRFAGPRRRRSPSPARSAPCWITVGTSSAWVTASSSRRRQDLGRRRVPEHQAVGAAVARQVDPAGPGGVEHRRAHEHRGAGPHPPRGRAGEVVRRSPRPAASPPWARRSCRTCRRSAAMSSARALSPGRGRAPGAHASTSSPATRMHRGPTPRRGGLERAARNSSSTTITAGSQSASSGSSSAAVSRQLSPTIVARTFDAP